MSSSDDSERKKRIAIIVVSSFLLVAVVVAVTVGVTIQEEDSDYNDGTTDGNKHAHVTSSKKAIKMICQPTTFKRTCEEQLQDEAGNNTDVKDLIRAAFNAAMKYVEQAQANSTLLRDLEKDEGTRSALDACKILLNSTMREFNKSLELVDKIEVNTVNKLLGDMKIWLSATISNQQACLDGFEKTKSKTEAGEKMKKFLNITMQLSRNGLAIACELSEQLQQLELAGLFEHRRLLQDEDKLPVIGHSDWTSFLERNKEWNRRRLLQDKDGLPVLGHSDWTSFLERNKEWNRRRLLQDEDGLPVLGHSDWTSFLERNKEWNRRRLLQDEDGLPVIGHSDWTSFLERNKEWNRRRLLQDEDGFPVIGHSDWTSFLERNKEWNRRRLLQEGEDLSIIEHRDIDLEIPAGARKLMSANLKPDLIVAQDGSGDCKTLNEAKQRIPLRSTKPFVIYVKAGVYVENVDFTFDLTHVALVGDGKDKTKITSNISTGPDGKPTTYFTATVGVDGDNFFAKNIAFENSAGPLKAQAVALRLQSDFAVFYNCSIDGYQDTLYVFSKRQFFRECTISGTIDFVFGDSAAVFQKCKFLVRKPQSGQQNIVTAQKRLDHKQPTAFVIMDSEIIPDAELAPVKNEFPAFLGRPWGKLSKAIIMQTYIDDMVHPEGWTSWDPKEPTNLCQYAEFNNTGPGASTSLRVKWAGVRLLNEAEAINYTPPKFFDVGDAWIKESGVPYTPDLSTGKSEDKGLITTSLDVPASKPKNNGLIPTSPDVSTNKPENSGLIPTSPNVLASKPKNNGLIPTSPYVSASKPENSELIPKSPEVPTSKPTSPDVSASKPENNGLIPTSPDVPTNKPENNGLIPTSPDVSASKPENSGLIPTSPVVPASKPENNGLIPTFPDVSVSKPKNSGLIPTSPIVPASKPENNGLIPTSPDVFASKPKNSGLIPISPDLSANKPEHNGVIPISPNLSTSKAAHKREIKLKKHKHKKKKHHGKGKKRGKKSKKHHGKVEAKSIIQA
ncbi:hypothetical protein J1N35_009683 [Gossypium stocksii]|uniref:pectinesterase n=1 Tax=Gossypium stocksii TaxID=47602 RepID=A0A9D4ABW5_9ROSI|nr:hypothetical protein J1N35_009683 [Gossypium stocksii]